MDLPSFENLHTTTIILILSPSPSPLLSPTPRLIGPSPSMTTSRH